MNYKLLWKLEVEAFKNLENDYHSLKTENVLLKEELKNLKLEYEMFNEQLEAALKPNDLTIKWRDL